ncbi:hypothetical protein [Rhodococcus qingshengii]|uniref:hypothetical protein n=2 Tax=Rhodococcus TaxID=1827 RepID=UPI001BAE700F|nr:hypothetical protein [Rhodococcus qingshengii]
MQRTVDVGPGAEDSGSEVAVFQYGSDRYEIPLDEAKRLMIDVQDVLNDQGTAGLVRVRVDGGEAVFLISGGALVTFHVPAGTTYYDGEDPAANSTSES